MTGRRSRAIGASALVPAPPEAVFSFLSDLENHWELGGPFIEVLRLDRPGRGVPADGGRVRMRGPLGVGRTAETRVTGAVAPHEMRGEARIGGTTRGHVLWTLHPDHRGTRVTLEATPVAAAPLDRALLALGGRPWLRRRFEEVLRRLAARLSTLNASSSDEPAAQDRARAPALR